MIIDFHSHILPGIDDGAKDIVMSRRMLEMEKNNGVEAIVATPHFYMRDHSMDSFLEKRQKAYQLIQSDAKVHDIKIHLGAEVYFSPSLADIDLYRLCIGNTNYMLIELPYQNLSQSFIQSFKNFVGSISGEINLILAHAERYLNFTSEESLLEILDTDIVVQLNCGSFKRFSSSLRFINKLISMDSAHLLGTDCHNITSRKPNMNDARRVIEKKYSQHQFLSFMNNAEKILSGKIL